MMSSTTGLNDKPKEEPRFVEEHKDSVAQDTGLLPNQDDDLPSEGEKLKTQIDPVLLHRSTSVTVGDIVNSNNEGIDETDQIRRLEKQKANQDALTESLMPGFPDLFIDTLANNYDDDHEIGPDGPERNSNDLSALTRRYARLSTSGVSEVEDSSVPGWQASNSARLSTSQKSSAESLNSFHLQSLPLDETSARGAADLYYKNAAKIIHQRDIESGEDGADDSSGDPDRSCKQKCLDRTKRRIAAVNEVFQEFAQPHKKRLRSSFKKIAKYIMLPSLFIAIILFYAMGNPPYGYALMRCRDKNLYSSPNRQLQTWQETSQSVVDNLNPFISNSTAEPPQRPTAEPTPYPTSSPTLHPRKVKYDLSDKRTHDLCIDENLSLDEASISWWFLFIGVRQMITFCLAVLMETIVIDFLMFRTRFFPRLIGTELALAVGQSKGWPCILFFWAIIDIILLCGQGRLARHWFFYQNFIALMNETNPSGGITGEEKYKRLLYFSIGLSVAATLKRTVMANFVGGRVVANYRHDLTNLIKKLLIVGELANLSKVSSERKVGAKSILFQRVASLGRDVIGNLEDNENDGEDDDGTDSMASEDEHLNSAASRHSPTNYSNNSIFVSQVLNYLDEWEEPELHAKTQKVSTKDVLHVRRAVEFISSDYPFSPSFGSTTTREECARASENVFNKLSKRDEPLLNFDVLCKIARNVDGTNDRKKILELVKMFRPSRQGEITKLEFVKSIDSVYKRLRLVLANINNSSQIDRAYDQITSVVFWSVAVLVGLSVFGYNVEALLITLAGLLVSFAFMIGSASSQYVEGILLILVRRPYDIGDKVCFMDPNADVDNFGPPGGGWIVESVDLYTTIVRKGTTREYATFTNGSLANSRILNLKRSEKANIYMYLKFTMDITQEQLNEFRRRLIEFIKDRPREWVKLVNLVCTHLETEQQYLKFTLIIQHRESWQSFGTIQASKSDIYIHALHLQKELQINYSAPKLPVHLTGVEPSALTRGVRDSDADRETRVSNQLWSQFRPQDSNSPTDSESIPQVLHDPSSKADLRRVPTSSNTGAVGAVDGSLVRRKGARSTNSEPFDLIEEGMPDQPMNLSEELPFGANSTTSSGSQAASKRRVSFAMEIQGDGTKNKDT